MKPQHLVLFDFDGTLSSRDTLSAFLFHSIPMRQWLYLSFKLSCGFFRLWRLGAWSNGRAKELLLALCFAGKTEKKLAELGISFYRKKFLGLLRKDAMQRLKQHQLQGDLVAVVSASADIWLRPFCEQEGLELLCTELEFVDGRFSGRLARPNCNGEEKARRVLERWDPADFQKVIAYGNSAGDKALFRLAEEAWLADSRGFKKIKG